MATGMTGGLPGAVSGRCARAGVSANRLLGGEVTSPESAEPDPWHCQCRSGFRRRWGAEDWSRETGFLPLCCRAEILDLSATPRGRTPGAWGVLFDTDEPLTRIYFMETGVTALLTTSRTAQLGSQRWVKRGWWTSTPCSWAARLLGRCQVLVPGMALVVEVSWFRDALGRSPKLRAACQAYTRALLVQILQAVPCNRLHTVEQRCARWLLMCADRTEGDTFEVARQGLAQMLGVAQPTLTIVARKLQSEGLIRFRRSAITVVDRRGWRLRRANATASSVIVTGDCPRAAG